MTGSTAMPRGASGSILHRLATLAIGTAVVFSVLLAVAAWRLSRGPVDIAWVTHRLEAAVNDFGGPTKLSIGSTAVAWEGFRLGVDRPVDLRLTDIRLTDTSGERHVDIPRAEVSLSLGALLRGRLQPRAVELDDPRITLRRAEDSTVTIDLGSMTEQAEPSAPNARRARGDPLPELLVLLAKPPSTDRTAAAGLAQPVAAGADPRCGGDRCRSQSSARRGGRRKPISIWPAARKAASTEPWM